MTPAPQTIVPAASRCSPIIDAVGIAMGDGSAEANLHAQLIERFARCIAQHRRESRQQARARLDQHDARRAGIDVAKVMAQRHPRQLGDGAGHLDAGGAAADHDEGEQASPLVGVVCCLGMLEGGEDAAADAGGVVDLLEAGRDTLPVVVAEIGMPRAGRQHEIVVGDGAVLEGDGAALPCRSPVTLPSMTWTLAALRRMARIGEAIWAGDRPAVATW